jgi:hypothetical protein
MYFQRLDVSAAAEFSGAWDPSIAPHAHPGSALVHKVFDHYHDILEEQVPKGGFGWGKSSLHNTSYMSGTYCSVSSSCMYIIDVWQEGFPPDKDDPVCVCIMFVPGIEFAERIAEPTGARDSE